MPVRQLADIARRYKLALATLFFLALALPSLETATLTLVYLLLTPDQAVDLVAKVLETVGWVWRSLMGGFPPSCWFWRPWQSACWPLARRARAFDFNKVISVENGRVAVSEGRAPSEVSAT